MRLMSDAGGCTLLFTEAVSTVHDCFGGLRALCVRISKVDSILISSMVSEVKRLMNSWAASMEFRLWTSTLGKWGMFSLDFQSHCSI